MTNTNNEDMRENTLIELHQLKNCLSLYSKMNIAAGEEIKAVEINALFSTLEKQVSSIIQNYDV